MVAGRQVLLLKKITHLSSLAEIMMNHLCAVQSGGESKALVSTSYISHGQLDYTVKSGSLVAAGVPEG